LHFPGQLQNGLANEHHMASTVTDSAGKKRTTRATDRNQGPGQIRTAVMLRADPSLAPELGVGIPVASPPPAFDWDIGATSREPNGGQLTSSVGVGVGNRASRRQAGGKQSVAAKKITGPGRGGKAASLTVGATRLFSFFLRSARCKRLHTEV
jgi:hypothetical protein